MGQEKYAAGFKVVKTHLDTLNIPFTWRTPKIVFVNSMSDLFHKNVPTDFIEKVFTVMKDNPQHVFQVLTKRADRLMEISNQLNWPHNVWMGVSVEDQRVVHRIDRLRHTGAMVKFLSLEPLIGPLPDLNLTGIHWVIVGGESGHHPRPMQPDWVLDIQDQCQKANVSFFFKQWGGKNKKVSGRLLKGRTWDEMPSLKPDEF